MNEQLDSDYRAGLHRWTLVVLCLVWPLIWVGSLVTTHDAGMSVPDWPNTYGRNLFLYPIETWLSGPFDLFIEHGHRLLGALVGFVAIAVVGVALWSEPRRWVQALAIAGLLLVIVQGVFGGMRVVLGDRLLAMIHGCTAPLVFALFTILAVVSSRWWKQNSSLTRKPVRTASWSCGWLVLFSYGQLVLGAQLRHVSLSATPRQFSHTVTLHIVLACGIWLLCGILWLRMWGCGEKALSRSVAALLGLVSIQILLGLATWVVNYGFPMFQDHAFAARYLVQAKSFWGSSVVSGHVATGSLILATAVLLGTCSWRIGYLQRMNPSLSPTRPLER